MRLGPEASLALVTSVRGRLSRCVGVWSASTERARCGGERYVAFRGACARFFLACQPRITEYQTSLLAVNLVDETLPAKVLEVRLRSAVYGIRLANLALGPMAGCDRQWQRLVLDVLKWTQGAVPC